MGQCLVWRTVLPVRLVQTSPSPSPSPSPRAHRRQARACRLVGGVDLAIHQNTVLFGKTPTVTPRRHQRRASGVADEPRAWAPRGGGSFLRTVPFLVGAGQWRTQPPSSLQALHAWQSSAAGTALPCLSQTPRPHALTQAFLPPLRWAPPPPRHWPPSRDGACVPLQGPLARLGAVASRRTRVCSQTEMP